MNQKGFSSILIILIIVGVLVVAGGVYFYEYRKYSPYVPQSYETTSITVLLPNGEEAWPMGTTQTIRWLSSSYTGSVDIRLIEGADGLGGDYIALEIPNTGFYQWNIPANLPIGYYKVLVATVGGGTINDTSDAVFSIIAAEN